MEPKPILTSKMLWFNFVMGLLTALLAFLDEFTKSQTLPESWLRWINLITVGGNIILRFQTIAPLDWSLWSNGISKPKVLPVLMAVACLSMAGCGAQAQQPRAFIHGPTAGVPGDKLILDASDSVGDHYRWDIVPRNSQARSGWQIDRTGKLAEVYSYPNIYDITLAVSNSHGIDITRWTLTVYAAIPPGPRPPGPLPGPPPPLPEPDPLPGPGPQPTPVPPEPQPDPNPPQPTPIILPGRFAVSRDVFEKTAGVPAVNLKGDCRKLADALDAISAQIAAGTLSGPSAILAAVKTQFNSALGGDVTKWLGFSEWLAGRLSEIYESKKLKTNSDWQVLTEELSAGFRARSG